MRYNISFILLLIDCVDVILIPICRQKANLHHHISHKIAPQACIDLLLLFLLLLTS